MAPSILDASPETPVDRRRIMRYALGAVAGAVALPVLAACGTTKMTYAVVHQSVKNKGNY